MGRHTEWRKQAKKCRRKRIRQQKAKERDEVLQKEQEERENSPRYQQWLSEQEAAKLFEEEEERRLAQIKHQEWLEREKEAQKQWVELQEKLAHIKEERRKQEERIQKEWEEEQKLIKQAKERKELEQKEKEELENLFKQQIEEYVINGGNIPEGLLLNAESNPGKDLCPFFSKVGVCRFGDSCSRNHIRPRVSNILLFHGFYTHISLYQTESEYGADSLLEYDEREMHSHFCEFFNDVLPELQKCGCVVQFRVCCNKEPHLRGNVYVEYISPRDTIRAYRSFQGRWYAGKQLNVEFCNITSWKAAICGLSFRKRCPKGSSCNFLHVFRNPGRMFEDTNFSSHSTREDRYSETNESSRNWRWTTPEREFKETNGDTKESRKSKEYENSWDRSKDRRRSSSKRSRSRSSSNRSRSRSSSVSSHRKEKRSKEREEYSKDKRKRHKK